MLIITILIAIFFIFVAISLYKGKNWARYLVSVLAILGIVGGIFGLFGSLDSGGRFALNLVSIIASGLIAWYLMKKDIKEQFE